jgi:hypothetical protein
MKDLEARLVVLGHEVEWPPEPDLRPAVRERIAAPRRRPLLRRRRALVVALAALAIAVGAAFAVPAARTAILDFFGVGGVRIERVPSQPSVRAGGDLGLGVRTTLDEARRRADYDVVLPAALPQPQDVYFSAALPGGQVGVVYVGTSAGRKRILFSEFRANGVDYIQKSAGPDVRIEPLTIDGGRGYWLSGQPHLLLYRAPDGSIREDTIRLAGNVLVWQRGNVTLRLEGVETKAEALRIARSVE